MTSSTKLDGDIGQTDLLDLPAHLTEIILAKLDPLSLCNVSRTSRSLQLLASEFLPPHLYNNLDQHALAQVQMTASHANVCP